MMKVYVCEETYVYTHRRSQSNALGYYKGASALPKDENKTQKIHNKGKEFPSLCPVIKQQEKNTKGVSLYTIWIHTEKQRGKKEGM